MRISVTDHSIVFENRYAKIMISQKDAKVESIFDKVHSKEMKGEDTYFFSLIAQDKETVVAPTAVRCCDRCITVETPLGDFHVAVTVEEEYFTFELAGALPAASYKCSLAHVKYSYDISDKRNTGAIGIAMTTWTNPCFYPDAKDRETRAEVVTALRTEGAKYGLIIAPIREHKELIKKVCLAIDPDKGLVTEYGGPWARDVKPNCGNYIIQLENSRKFVEGNIEFYKSLGVDQIDFHQWPTSFRQGDFKYVEFDSHAQFKKDVVELLEENGMSAGLHTYAHYIDYGCDGILSDPKWQKDLAVLATFTLAEDINADAAFIPTAESTADVCDDYGFFNTNSPYVMIGEELIRFENDDHGFKVAQRGACGTKAVAHAKGEQVKHMEAMFRMFAPVLGSELFYQIARNTANAYNEGGYKMIYLDALDGVHAGCRYNEDISFYYLAEFLREVLKWCHTTPIIECSTLRPSIWAARGRLGNFDTPYRAFKWWNKECHLPMNLCFLDMYTQPSLGWYYFYATTDEYPGNEHTKYQHWDSAEYIGALAAMYNFNMVFADTDLEKYRRLPALRRNIAIYRRCDELRKAGYFSEDFLRTVRKRPWEQHIVQKDDGSYVFVEKDYQVKKLFDLGDAARNKACYSNPFAVQKPFVRIEALMSAKGTNPQVLLKLDKNKDLTEQVLENSFGGETDLASKLAKTVSVLGNGKAGGAIAIKMRAGTNSEKGFAEYIIDTDFEGWRDFVLLEADNGERPDLPFDRKEYRDLPYSVIRAGFKHERATRIAVETTGDMTGVKMTDIVAVNHMYEVLKNPTVRLGDSAVTFACELMSTDFIEFDGSHAKVIDRNGNEKPVYFTGELTAPAGSFEAELTAKPLNGGVARAQLTFGFTGQESKQSTTVPLQPDGCTDDPPFTTEQLSLHF